VRAIAAGRQNQPFSGLHDLLVGVPLQSKEMTHLIECGAIDCLEGRRAALLAKAREVEQDGRALQMTFGFARPDVAPESAAQRLA
jgi:DNA polymerase III alpha subunit